MIWEEILKGADHLNKIDAIREIFGKGQII
jgi:hypothetical protein